MKNEWMKFGRDNGILVHSQSQSSSGSQSLAGIDRGVERRGRFRPGSPVLPVSSLKGRGQRGGALRASGRCEDGGSDGGAGGCGGAQLPTVAGGGWRVWLPRAAGLRHGGVGTRSGPWGLGAVAAGRGGASGAGGSGARRAGVRVGCGVPGRNVPGVAYDPDGHRVAHVPSGGLDKTLPHGLLGLGGARQAGIRVGHVRCGVTFRGYRVRGAACGRVGAASPTSGFWRCAASLPRPLPSPGWQVPPAPGGLLSGGANWCVGGAAAPGMLGTRGADSGAPATLGHRAQQHPLQWGSECDAYACYPCSRELRPEEHCKFQASLGYKTTYSK
jgi:hypothetical protein